MFLGISGDFGRHILRANYEDNIIKYILAQNSGLEYYYQREKQINKNK